MIYGLDRGSPILSPSLPVLVGEERFPDVPQTPLVQQCVVCKSSGVPSDIPLDTPRLSPPVSLHVLLRTLDYPGLFFPRSQTVSPSGLTRKFLLVLPPPSPLSVTLFQ